MSKTECINSFGFLVLHKKPSPSSLVYRDCFSSLAVLSVVWAVHVFLAGTSHAIASRCLRLPEGSIKLEVQDCSLKWLAADVIYLLMLSYVVAVGKSI